MDALESQIREWRVYVERGEEVDARDVEELETHLRDEIADLSAASLADDEPSW